MSLRGATALCALLVGCTAPPPLVVPPLAFGLPRHWVDAPLLPAVGEGWVVVTNSLDDTLSVFALADVKAGRLVEIARLPVGLSPVTLEGPHHAASAPSGDRFYVGISNFVPGAGSGPHGAHGTGTADGYLLELDGTGGRQLRSLRVDRNPGDLVISDDGKTALVTHFDLLRYEGATSFADTEAWARLAVIDLETMSRRSMVPLCAAPHGVRITSDGSTAFVACLSDQIARVDLGTGEVQRFPVASDAAAAPPAVHEPYAVALSPAGDRLWVSSIRSGQLQVFDTATLQPVTSIPLGGPPYFGTFSADGSTFFVPRQGDDRLVELDAATFAVKREVLLRAPYCQNLHQVQRLDPGRALVVCEGDRRSPGALLLVDLALGTVITFALVGLFPDSVSLVVHR